MKKFIAVTLSILLMLCCDTRVVIAGETPIEKNEKAIATAPPTIQVIGLSEGDAFCDDVAFGFWMTDTDLATARVRLTQTSREVSQRDVTRQFLEVQQQQNSVLGGGYDFPRRPEYDGIYHLTLSCTDTSGHCAQRDILFSVNRFGSTYAYCDALYALIEKEGAAVSSIGEDLIITEYNPSPLYGDSLRIEVTRDGSPVSDLQYVFHRLPRKESEQLFAYEYILKKENFQANGRYRVSISTRDTAGNVQETSTFSDIVFFVDDTPPELTGIQGLEHSIQKGDKQEGRFFVYDGCGLASVEALVDGVPQTLPPIRDMHHYEGSFYLTESPAAQSIRIVATDLAGNVTDTSDAAFHPHYAFYDRVLLSSSQAQRLYIRIERGVMLLQSAVIGCLDAAYGVWESTTVSCVVSKKGASSSDR